MSIKDDIKKDISSNKIIVYMKGSPEAPMCGFSAQVASILKTYQVPFASRNVLENEELRSAIKEYSDWPTIPQVYINGKFIGGCDIVTEMHNSGELRQVLENEDII